MYSVCFSGSHASSDTRSAHSSSSIRRRLSCPSHLHPTTPQSLFLCERFKSIMDFNGSSPFPEGVISFLDTDLYKLTMQCAVLQYFPKVPVTYAFKNRTPEKKLSRAAFKWLQIQINSKSLSLVQSPTFNRSKQFSDSRFVGGI